MRRSISGREIEFEIPLLVALFYLFCGVETEARFAVPSLLALNPGLFRGDLRRRQRQVGSLAGAAHLLNDNTGVLRSAQ